MHFTARLQSASGDVKAEFQLGVEHARRRAVNRDLYLCSAAALTTTPRAVLIRPGIITFEEGVGASSHVYPTGISKEVSVSAEHVDSCTTFIRTT